MSRIFKYLTLEMSLSGKSVERGFVHSVKVPRIYKTASSIVKRVVENGESLKQLVYSTRHKNIKGVYALVVETIKHSQTLNNIIEKSKLLQKETRLESWLARILITEMLFRKKELKGMSKPIQTVLSYREEFLKYMGKNRNTELVKEDQVLGVFMIYSLAMFTVPLVTFFGVQEMLKKKFGIEGFNNIVWSVISAVAIVNVIIILYARRAYHEEMDDEKSNEPKGVKKPRYVRVNTLHYTPDEIVKIFKNEGWIFLQPPGDYASFLSTVSQMGKNEFTKDFHVKELLVFPPTAQFYKNELYINGSIILQDKASCLPVCLLQPSSKATVLDMCSAPGLKTSHLSAKMKNKGTIYAVEMNASRYKTLCEFVKKVGCTNVVPINMDSLKIGEDSSDTDVDTSWYKEVEYILVDPSCSGTGIVERQNIFTNEKKDNERIKKLCAFQFKLLLHALTKFPNVKRVVYCTCSVFAVENEKVVEDVLRRLSEMQSAENVNDENGFNYELVEVMKDSWPGRGSSDFEIGKYCLFADPERDFTNGFFVALFERVLPEKKQET